MAKTNKQTNICAKDGWIPTAVHGRQMDPFYPSHTYFP